MAIVDSEQPGAESILVVEDDDLVRACTVDLLEELGHSVLEAHSAEEAMSVIRARRIDVLFTDVGLPGTSGDVFAAEARSVQPHLHIVFATGTDRIPDVPGGGGPVLLRKPFDGPAIAAALRRARPADPAA